MLRKFISMASKYLKFLIFVLLPFSLLIWAILQGYSFKWTGFAKKTLWDWMDLLIIPIILGIGAFYLNRSERESDRQRAEERAIVEREIATDRQRENALQSYIDRMADLLLNEKLRTTKNKEVRDVARTRTLSVLSGLDANRKTLLFQFLKEAKLICIKKPVIELQGADLSGASLTGADLSSANLFQANLSGADLFHTNLSGADLGNANLTNAYLYEADLSRADLLTTDLSDADLTDVNLSGADLRVARLRNADLTDADLTEADLSSADLSGAKVTKKQLEKAKSLKNAIMPDGTKHD